MTDTPGGYIPILTTERLQLRVFRDADREPLAALNADPEVMRYLGPPLTLDESDAMIERILRRWADDGHGLWAVERLEDGRFLGFTGIARLA